MSIAYGAKSDIGLKRTHNEDRFCIDPSLGLYVVCDGMGGHKAGEVASALAVEVIQKHLSEGKRDAQTPIIGRYEGIFLPQTNRLASAIRLANQAIHCEAQHHVDYARMGTTVVSALISGQILSFAHVGDSRLYLIRGETIHPLTMDHSLVMEQIRDGLLTEEEAERSAQRHIVTRALGIDSIVDVELGELPIMSGDLLLLCSDGLTRGVQSVEIVRAIHAEPDLQAASERLIALANAAGGDDNTTVILLAPQHLSRPCVWRRILDLIWRPKTRLWN
ncbi:MAG: Stp1/IreP family PP2C-type Ser/Thr phosphatase [Nitrospirota bacterium]|nr:Stp1/IreP family PP2C-type Ser/Thr phosphatase [Nitrospirota bacterium]